MGIFMFRKEDRMKIRDEVELEMAIDPIGFSIRRLKEIEEKLCLLLSG